MDHCVWDWRSRGCGAQGAEPQACLCARLEPSLFWSLSLGPPALPAQLLPEPLLSGSVPGLCGKEAYLALASQVAQ